MEQNPTSHCSHFFSHGAKVGVWTPQNSPPPPPSVKRGVFEDPKHPHGYVHAYLYVFFQFHAWQLILENAYILEAYIHVHNMLLMLCNLFHATY